MSAGAITEEISSEAINLANNTEFGLGGIMFSSDQKKVVEDAEAMNTGSVGLNFFASNHAAPFGGRNDSGLGVEYGRETSPATYHTSLSIGVNIRRLD